MPWLVQFFMKKIISHIHTTARMLCGIKPEMIIVDEFAWKGKMQDS